MASCHLFGAFLSPSTDAASKFCSFVRSLAGALVAKIFRRRGNFGDAKIFEKKVWVVAIVFVKKSSKSELSSRFSSRLKILQGLEGRLETSEVPIWRSCEFLRLTSRFVSKNYPRRQKILLSRIFGGGVKVAQRIFFSTFGPKLTCTFLVQ